MGYRPLDAARNEMRLLKVLPRKDGEIQCIMDHFSLDDFTQESKDYLASSDSDVYRSKEFWYHSRQKFQASGLLSTRPETQRTRFEDETLILEHPELLGGHGRWNWGDYSALSYTWGTWDDAQEIHVNGHSIRVTKNLHAFLQTMESSIWLWIDALCINQEDGDERNLQVKRMKAIYEQAFSVIAWLGPESEDSKLAIDFFRHVGLNNSASCTTPNQALAFLRSSWFDDQTAELIAAQRLTQREYWMRLWIVQEIALGRHMIVVLCGKDRLNWAILSTAVELLIYDNSLIYRRYESACKAMGVEFELLVGYHRLWQLSRFKSSYEKGKTRLHLAEVLALIRKSNQTDARDKVYGAINLLDPSVAAHIVPDYKLPIRQNYVNFVIAYLNATKKLDIIRQARHNWETESWPAWPSWLPDLRLPAVDAEFDIDIPYNASVDTEVDTSMKGSYISAKGFRVDTVDGVGSNNTWTARMKNLDVADMKQMEQPTHSNNPYTDEEDQREALWRTLFANRDMYGSLVPEEYKSVLYIPVVPDGDLAFLQDSVHFPHFSDSRAHGQDFLMGGRPYKDYFLDRDPTHVFPPVEALEHMFQRASSVMAYRRLMVTSRGYFGLVSYTVQKGDIVVILFGCSVPMILRPCEEGYRLVGEAYIHGMMEGLEWLKDEEVHVETFDIY
ncbi:hypothetical protein EG329_005467 [Mollisiaceae sp. DMI_Dod_QoI]|nr:hypothetical protein EG329_005467 [Helotiales sp. DMI_Dod_QoI]